MTFTENWFDLPSQQALVDLYYLTANLEGGIVEVGSWEGRSSVALANACHPHTLHCVDTWEGSPGEISRELACQRDVFAQFTENIGMLTAGNVEAHRMGWRDYFAANTTRVRFLFIDAEHTYREVKDNIEAALPLMGAGGVICGDDVHHPPIQQAVWDTLGNVDSTATLWWAQT